MPSESQPIFQPLSKKERAKQFSSYFWWLGSRNPKQLAEEIENHKRENKKS